MEEDTALTWERVQSDKMRNTIRLRVPGGWIYMVVPKVGSVAGGAEGQPTAPVFVPDPGSHRSRSRDKASAD